MRRKHNVLLSQVNYRYGDNVFVPYSIGTIQAYSETIPGIKENFQFQEMIFLREDPTEIVMNTQELSVAGFSCYLWNWEYNNALAKLIKAKFPQCLIVFGGPQVPDVSDDFFIAHPYVDILVHHEGEFSFSDILLELLSRKPDYTKIPGLSVQVSDSQTLKTPARGRISDLSKLPSPYLSGTFDFLLDKQFVLNVCQETNRGCPYSCQFCDWGGSVHSKVVPIAEERILSEFEWFGEHHAEYLFNCDANYGILPRDHNLVVKLVKIRDENSGYPKRFRMCTAKNSNDKIFGIAQILADAGMNKGASLSFQSMDDDTLEVIERKNIKIKEFGSLMDRYNKAGISTLTELILGLPGETYETSKKGISTLIDAQEDSINIYVNACTVLPNSGMNRPSFVKQHGIKSVSIPILLAHSTPSEDSIVEYNEMVVETATMKKEDWLRTFIFYLVVQCFHCLGLTRHISILFRRQFDLNYGDFYERLISHFGDDNKTLIGRQLALISDVVRKAIHGGRVDLVIPNFGDIYWPLEEAMFLHFVSNKDKFYREVLSFIGSISSNLGQDVEDDLLNDVILYQSFIMIDPFISELSIDIRYDLHEYFNGESIDRSVAIEYVPTKLKMETEKDFRGDLEKYGREVAWYGRKGGKFHHTNITKTVAQTV